LNPAPGQPLDLQRAGVADYLIPNETEAEALAGIAVRKVDDARRCAQRMIEQGARRAIITLGSQGALLAGTEAMEHIPPFAVEPVDTTGAGDAFIGSLAVFLASGFEEREAIARSNLYAALSTLAVGTQKSFVTLERFESEWATRRKAAAL
jgi:ribokinase